MNLLLLCGRHPRDLEDVVADADLDLPVRPPDPPTDEIDRRTEHVDRAELDGEPARDVAQSLRPLRRRGRLDGTDVRDVEGQKLRAQHRRQIEQLANVVVARRVDLEHELRDSGHPDPFRSQHVPQRGHPASRPGIRLFAASRQEFEDPMPSALRGAQNGLSK